MKTKDFTGLLYSVIKVSTISLIVLTLLFSNIGVRPAHAATTWTVTSLADDGIATASNCPHVSDCRLRDAIAAALPGDTIIFAANLSGQTIHLASTLTLSQNIIIDGSALASQIIISGDTDSDSNNDIRVITIDAGSTVTLNSVIIIKGRASTIGGGGILNYGTLTITNSTILKNEAIADTSGGGILSFGPLAITNSVFSNNHALANGGGIQHNSGTATITNTIFESNHAEGGGAIHNNSATLTVIKSTFSGNSGNLTGGGIATNGPTTITGSTFSGNYSNYRGGGISNNYSLTKITNSTFANNSATTKGGAIYNWFTGMEINNSTISGNTAPLGGGIYNNGTLNYVNTIVANSVGADCLNGDGGINTINTNNLVEDGSCTPLLLGDPKLGALASNGGPTQTIALLAGSIAINAGDDVACAAAPVNNLDQRGFTRPRGGHCDLGAYESPFSIATYRSVAAQDGWILESSETSNQGLNTLSTFTLLLGDDVAKKQYRSILSFNTSSLPDTAVIGSVVLNVKHYNIVGGGNPIAIFQGMMVDIKTGMFGTAALQSGDFQAGESAIYGPFVPALLNGWYSMNISNAKTYINKLTANNGLTQIRLRFKLDDNNNALANTLSFFGGDAGTASAPQLIIHYYVP